MEMLCSHDNIPMSSVAANYKHQIGVTKYDVPRLTNSGLGGMYPELLAFTKHKTTDLPTGIF